MRGRGGWPAPGAQSISWRKLRVDNAAGVAANGALLFRADFGPAVMLSALPVFWRSVVGRSFGISSVRLRACSLSDASFLWPVHSRYWKTYSSFLFCNPAPAVISVRAVEKPTLSLFFAHLTAFLINLVAGWRAIRIDPRNVGARMLLAAALLGLGLTHQAAQRLDTTHVLFAAVVSLGLAPLSLFILLP